MIRLELKLDDITSKMLAYQIEALCPAVAGLKRGLEADCRELQFPEGNPIPQGELVQLKTSVQTTENDCL